MEECIKVNGKLCKGKRMVMVVEGVNEFGHPYVFKRFACQCGKWCGDEII